jgi:hypothetical protein
MPRPPFRFLSRVIAVLTTAACVVAATRAQGQACCAAAGVVTPARLAPDELALVGTQWKVGDVLGSFDPAGRYASSPPAASELDFEQDIFGAARLLGRGQVALFVPVVETRRTSLGQSEFGGGIGDVNASVRYDFTLAGGSPIVPGLAGLAGVTLPTGTPPDAPNLGPLATGATGIGAYQINAGAAVEQTFGPWLVSATGIVAQRTARTVGVAPNQVHERLAPQWTALAVAAYTFHRPAKSRHRASSLDAHTLWDPSSDRHMAPSRRVVRQLAHPVAGDEPARRARAICDPHSLVDALLFLPDSAAGQRAAGTAYLASAFAARDRWDDEDEPLSSARRLQAERATAIGTGRFDAVECLVAHRKRRKR